MSKRDKSTAAFTREIDQRIIAGFLVDPETTLRELATDGFTREAVIDRAGALGLTNDFLKGHRLGRFDAALRRCLNCDEAFLSLGPQNRLCSRCRKRL